MSGGQCLQFSMILSLKKPLFSHPPDAKSSYSGEVQINLPPPFLLSLENIDLPLY